MRYRAVGNRCAIHFPSLNLPISDQEAVSILEQLGFSVRKIDVVRIAQKYAGVSRYQRGISIYEAPCVVDCSSFTKWLYAQKGVWLPRLSIQQYQEGIAVDIPQKGDLVFTKGSGNLYDTDPSDSVGHVGIATGNNTVIHAANKKLGVVESNLALFLHATFRGIRRITQKETVTVNFPSQFLIESSDDIRWLILRKMK